MKRIILALMFVHRYLGVAFCLIFVVWFASGIVMVYKRLPDVLAAHGDTIRVLHTLQPVGVAMAGIEEFDPYKD